MIELVKSQLVKGGYSKRGDGNTMKISERTTGTIDEVSDNLKALFDSDSTIKQMAYLYLVGGSNCVKITSALDGHLTLLDCDGAVTNQPITLAITVADCFPVLMVDEQAGVAGISHAGWKGSKDNLTTKVVNDMISLGANAENIKASIGPGICKKCFEVGEDVAILFDNSVVDRDSYEKPHVDILRSNLKELDKLGIKNVETSGVCTYENYQDYYSARKEVNTGRFIAYITNTA